MLEASLGLALLALGAAGSPAGAAPIGSVPAIAPSDLDHILLEAQKRQKEDVAAWRRFRFRRLSEREQLDDSGSVLEREDLEFLVTPNARGFDELLLRLDGREPEAAEIGRHRRIARFTRHYDALLAGEGQQDEEDGYSLSQLLRLSAYRYAGQETYSGVACHRLDFSPDETGGRGGLAGKFAGAMAGSLWITVDGHHLAGAKAKTVHPVSIALSLSKVHDLEVSLESQRVMPGIWLPRRIEVKTRARVLFKPIRKRNTYAYRDFEPVRGAATDPGTR
jgi:hypothetical protein